MELWEGAFKELRDQYVRGSSERLEKIERNLAQLEADPQNSEALRELLRHFHGLSGSGTTYGFPQVTAIALKAEQECDALLKKQLVPQSMSQWREALIAIREEFQKDIPVDAPREPEASPKRTSKVHEILLIDDDPDISYLIAKFIEQEGMKVQSVRTRAEAREILLQDLPDGVIVDVHLPDGSGYEIVEHLRTLPAGDIPSVIMVSVSTGFLDKVEAIRCGADGFFEKPVDWEALMRRLLLLLERNKIESPRILSVEDDPDQASYIQKALEQGGYQVKICADPKTFEQDLVSFRPDLVIMDILLPGVTGYDLARYLRQDETHATLPVLFLTTQSQLQVKIETVKAGGDDHLVKPVQPGLLLSTVAARIERSRFLKSLLDRDGLTRLLTHTAFLERAKSVVSKRQRVPNDLTALAMIDLDHFKKINDTYGHMVGDRVLTSLSALLRRRLRQSDIIGRYGGEEFAIIIDDLKEGEALRLLTRLLEEFHAIEHRASDGQVFNVSFSAGVAMFDPATMDLEAWKVAADNALYEAKAQGRNRVVSASALKAQWQ